MKNNNEQETIKTVKINGNTIICKKEGNILLPIAGPKKAMSILKKHKFTFRIEGNTILPVSGTSIFFNI